MLSIIAAVASNNAIGISKSNAMPWHISGDLKYFKKLTFGKTMIMGRKTFESLPRILPNRRHVVITRDPGYARTHPGIETVGSLSEAITNAPSGEEAFIIGGGSVYNEALPFCEHLYITEIYADYDADVFFPEFDKTGYEIVSRSEVYSENGVNYRFLCYRRLN